MIEKKYEFREVARKINPRSFVDVIKIENDFYLVTLYYTGAELREGKKLDIHQVTFSCQPKDDNFILKTARGEVVTIDDPELVSIRPKDVSKIIRRLRIAEESAYALKDKLSEYF